VRRELDRLLDIHDAIENICEHPRHPDGKKGWDEDKYYRGYCERQLGIFGEAASCLTTDFGYEATHSEIPWRQIKALRNILVHMYWGSDPKILWNIVENYLPELKDSVDKWIDEKEKQIESQSTEEKNPNRREGKLSRKIRELAEKERPPEQ
jgi:uncharacterized protein with HEPN domain